MSIANALDTAYQQAHYRVRVQPAFTLRIGEFSPAMQALLQASRVETAAFITACNPGSAKLTHAENAMRQLALQSLLSERSLPWLPGVGENDDASWQEPSFLVLGLDREAARAMASAFGQNAIVWIQADAIPRLVWTD